MPNRTTNVGSDYERLFSALPAEVVPTYLCERVAGLIREKRLRNARARLVVASLSGIASLVGCVIAIVSFDAAASGSGFFAYASLLLSDSGLIVNNFSIFGLSLLESLPVIEAVLVGVLVAACLASIRVFVLSTFSYRHLITLS
jgi:hypothetical protein